MILVYLHVHVQCTCIIDNCLSVSQCTCTYTHTHSTVNGHRIRQNIYTNTCICMYRIAGLFREGKLSFFTLQKTFVWFKIRSARLFHCHTQNFVWINVHSPRLENEKNKFGLAKQTRYTVRTCIMTAVFVIHCTVHVDWSTESVKSSKTNKETEKPAMIH